MDHCARMRIGIFAFNRHGAVYTRAGFESVEMNHSDIGQLLREHEN